MQAYQLSEAGQTEAAQRVLSDLSRHMLANGGKRDIRGVTNLALVSIRFGVPLPAELSGLIAGFVANGYLSVEQDVALLQQLQESGDAGLAMTAVKTEGLETGKLTVMKELESLAIKAGDTQFAANLAPRIAAAEQAREDLQRIQLLSEGQVL